MTVCMCLPSFKISSIYTLIIAYPVGAHGQCKSITRSEHERSVSASHPKNFFQIPLPSHRRVVDNLRSGAIQAARRHVEVVMPRARINHVVLDPTFELGYKLPVSGCLNQTYHAGNHIVSGMEVCSILATDLSSSYTGKHSATPNNGHKRIDGPFVNVIHSRVFEFPSRSMK